MAATIDSGNETLFSDDSPCDLTVSPSVHATDDPEVTECHRFANSRPPNIQPYSGVLEKGRVVIRPIAFRPGMSPAARFGLDGERYGSTPTLNGCSADIRPYMLPNSNYSLDRRLRSSCQSTASSPPFVRSSLTSLPQKLSNYDSLESVRRSPVSTADSTLTNKSFRLINELGESILDLTPSPSDSGVSELEAALRDRDSELAYLRQTMEHNEQVIFRVYQEKERVWERELKKLQSLHENRLRTSAQKALKLEQLLMMQTYQLQQDKKRLTLEAQKAGAESDRLRQEVGTLKDRLEETEWNLCQKTGEMSLLKSQLKELQLDQTLKGHELLQIRNEYRDIKDALDTRELEATNFNKLLMDKNTEVEKLKLEIQTLNFKLNRHHEPFCSSKIFMEHPINISLHNEGAKDDEETESSSLFKANRKTEISKLKEVINTKHRDFEEERQKWADEKEKVLKYQRQLQMNYIHMFRRTKSLESEVESLTIELELDKTGIKKKLSTLDINHTIEL